MTLLTSQTAVIAADSNCYVIKKISQAHCQRGPERCQKCKEMSANAQYSLLNICPKTPAARRVTEVDINGKKEWREYDVERSFDSLTEARTYAESRNIQIMGNE